jgi:tetratricopeptide (TPR) repeat protein
MIEVMAEDFPAGYLAGLPDAQRERLARVNDQGLNALRKYLCSGQAVAFLGAGVSAPLYPLWDGLINDLVDASADRLNDQEVATCRALAKHNPEEVVEIVRQLGAAKYREVLREVLRARTDPESGRSWTQAQELVCRCAFKAVVTTNYDPGIVNARMRVRSRAFGTGFMTWEDELGLDRWRTGEVFGDDELPVLFAHGQHNRPDSIVLATTEYRRAYAGKLPRVLGALMDAGHLVWIGFSFADQRVAAILREIAEGSGPRVDPGAAPRHIAIMAWDPDGEGNDPGILGQRTEIGYGAQLVLYPAPGGDHSALATLLSALADPSFPGVADVPARAGSPAAGADRDAAPGGPMPVTWMPPAEPVPHFTGRADELARLDRWAAGPEVALVGVTAWGGAGKTALVTRWVQAAGAVRRPGLRGVFGWSFYADPSAENWAEGLLRWSRQELGIQVAHTDRPAAAVLALLRAVPVLLVLDGLEVLQQGPAGDGFGRLLDGTLREVLAGACQQRHAGLVVLTSRFPFADLEAFDGGSARMLEVPPFTAAEGSDLLAAAGGDWLADAERRALVEAVDGHALAVGVLAGLLADRPPSGDLAALQAELAAATRTSARVGRVLEFYSGRLSEPERYLLAAVSLFARPVPAEAVLAVAGHEAFAGHLAGWTTAMVQTAVAGRLGGLASWHPDGTVSAHPLVRDTFRRLVMGAAEVAAETALTGMPEGKVTSRADALRVVEAIELLLDADQWQAANDMYRARVGAPPVWLTLPAARLGQRAATAFVATPARRETCAEQLGHLRLGFYINAVGLLAMNAGDLVTAHEFLSAAVRHYRDVSEMQYLSFPLQNLAECLGHLGELGEARAAAAEALSYAAKTGDLTAKEDSHAYLGWLATLTGEAAEAEMQFTAADPIEFANHPSARHLYSAPGIWWAEWLAQTGRPGPARVLTDRNIEICRRGRWNDHLARCDRLQGRLALAAGDTTTAGPHLMAAAECFRDGDFLVELALTLTDLAEHARVVGDLDAAERHVTEAITIAGPRGLVPAQSAALAARARIRASQAAAGGNRDYIAQGRDAAEAALRLATRHHLAWQELDALNGHAALDQAEGADRGWAARADALHARLVPPGLDPDPLSTVERLVAEQRAAERKAAGQKAARARRSPHPRPRGRK